MLTNKQIKKLNVKAFKQCKHKELFKRIKFNLVAIHNKINLFDIGVFTVIGSVNSGFILEKKTLTLDKILTLKECYKFITKYIKVNKNKIFYSRGLFYIV
jgi:hypothetical protein